MTSRHQLKKTLLFFFMEVKWFTFDFSWFLKASKNIFFGFNPQWLPSLITCQHAWHLRYIHQDSSPGHSSTSQTAVQVSSPMQSLPPIWGEGSVQVRVKVFSPRPQVTEQGESDVQGDQWPWTGGKHRNKKDKKMILSLVIIWDTTVHVHIN